jgi:hypothetical protein
MTDRPQVVITRKDKRLKKGWHLLAFALTGGTSAPISAAKATTNALYNERTRELQRQAREPDEAEAREPDEMETGAAREASEVQQVVAAAKARQRVILGMASRRLNKLERSA